MTPAAEISLLVLDVDGVLTDGRLWYGPDGEVAKAFHVRDGHGIKLLHRAGVATGIVSGRADEYVRERAEELGMSVALIGCEDKGEAVRSVLAERGLAAGQAAFLGDDTIDAPAFRAVGVPIAVADAHADVLRHVKFVTRNPGGRGAVREVADLILRARGAEA